MLDKKFPTMMKCILLLLVSQANYCHAFSPQSPVRAQLGTQPLDNSGREWRLSSSASDDDSNPFGFLRGIFSVPSGGAAIAEPEPKLPDVVVDTDYKLAAAFGVVGASIFALNNGVGGLLGGGFIALLASLFAVQATRLRFVFDEDCFELKSVESLGSDELQDSGENIVVGGANRWAYDSFVNWDFYPSVDFPILVYFKETQTPQTDGSSDGQIHFFPAIANAKQLEEQFELRGCASVRES